MKRHLALVSVMMIVLGVQSAMAAPQAVHLVARDGVAITGAFYPSQQHKALILLFHQAGSSKDEYRTIAPRLVASGYDALAIDQRSGGSLFGPNQTASGVTGAPSYSETQRDLEAAFHWGLKRNEPLILWGSSYSAALVFRVAAAHPGQVAAVVAFSPGEYLHDQPSVAESAAHITAPVFVTSASTPAEIGAAQRILDATQSTIKVQYVPRVGVHGSSTLIAARDPEGAAANWAAISAFLSKVAP